MSDQLKRVLNIIGHICPDSVCLEPRFCEGPELYGDPYRLPVPQLDSVGRVLRHALEMGYLDVEALETRLMEDTNFRKAVHIKYGNKVGCSYMLSGWALRSMPLQEIAKHILPDLVMKMLDSMRNELTSGSHRSKYRHLDNTP